MILERNSELSKVAKIYTETERALLEKAELELKTTIKAVGLGGTLGALAKLCAEECKGNSDPTGNFLAASLDLIAGQAALFYDYELVRKKEENK